MIAKARIKLQKSLFPKFILVILFGSLLFCLLTNDVFAAAYYMSPNGNDSNLGSISQPWKTFAKALARVSCGDTLYLMNGTYDADMAYNSTYNMYITHNCTSGQPLPIKALNESCGSACATVEGLDAKEPLRITYASYINIEGIRFQNSNAHVVEIDNSNHINLRRLSAYDAEYEGNYHN